MWAGNLLVSLFRNKYSLERRSARGAELSVGAQQFCKTFDQGSCRNIYKFFPALAAEMLMGESHRIVTHTRARTHTHTLTARESVLNRCCFDKSSWSCGIGGKGMFTRVLHHPLRTDFFTVRPRHLTRVLQPDPPVLGSCARVVWLVMKVVLRRSPDRVLRGLVASEETRLGRAIFSKKNSTLVLELHTRDCSVRRRAFLVTESFTQPVDHLSFYRNRKICL